MANRVSPEQTKALLDSGAGYVYLDVRTVQEFDSGHVPGAKNVPFLEAGFGGMTVNPNFISVVARNYAKDAKLICGCQKGGRSLRAAEVLRAAGFSNVVDMVGGFGGETDACGCVVNPGWATVGLPVAKDSALEDRYSSLQSH